MCPSADDAHRSLIPFFFYTHIVVAAILFGLPIKGVEALFAII